MNRIPRVESTRHEMELFASAGGCLSKAGEVMPAARRGLPGGVPPSGKARSPEDKGAGCGWPAYLPGGERRELLTKEMPRFVGAPAVFHGTLNRLEGGTPVSGRLVMELASEKIRIARAWPWSERFSDPEDTFALHRFRWALSALAQSPRLALAERLWAGVQDWIRVQGKNRAGPAWQPYTVSERAVNWLILWNNLSNARWNVLKGHRRFFDSLVRHGQYLAGHLEYHGPERTNNHLIQNGRGLYWIGRAVGHRPWLLLGRSLLIHEAHRMFTKSGFLGEESSHYQWLVARTYLEVLGIERPAKYDLFFDRIRKLARRMLDACEFFQPLSTSPFPLLGDVSPDCSTEWLSGLVHRGRTWVGEGSGRSPHGLGWHVLWSPGPNGGGRGHGGRPRPLSDTEWVSHPDAGWHRFRNGAYTVFFHAPSVVRPRHASHGHMDADAFELHWGSDPIFVDTGRSTYCDDATGWHAKSSFAHNSILVDHEFPFIVFGVNWDPQLPNEYVARRVGLAASPLRKGWKIVLAHDGFTRLDPRIRTRRSFTCLPDRFLLWDCVQGSGVHTVTSFFHFHPSIEQVDMESDGCSFVTRCNRRLTFATTGDRRPRFSLVRGQNHPYPLGWYSPRYGKRVPSYSLKVEYRGVLPHSTRYELEGA